MKHTSAEMTSQVHPVSRVDVPSRPAGVSLVAPYVSRCLAERRLQQPDRDVFGGLVEGTLLFADISGFTTLSEHLGQRGNEGAEELTFVLNDYFEQMVEIVAGHGGDLLQFGGDSLLAVFGVADATSDGGGAADSAAAAGALQAVRCGLEMQAAMRPFEQLATSAGTCRLSMSIAVHRGPFLLASAGAHAGQVQQIVMGSTLNRLAEVESTAAPGEVLITSEAAELLEDRVLCDAPRSGCLPVLGLTRRRDLAANAVHRLRFDEADTDWFDESRAAAAEKLLRPYLIPAVYRRLVEDPGGVGSEGEHRFIATMFVHFVGLSDRPTNESTPFPLAATERETHDVQELVSKRGLAPVTTLNPAETNVRQVPVPLLKPVEGSDPGFGPSASGLLRACDPARTAEAVAFLDRYLAAMAEVIVRHGGALARVSADVRGDKLLVLFGAPLALEHPEECALECALAMNQRLAELNAGAAVAIEQRIAISSGSAFCGSVGSRRRREYTVIADSVNTAARLMLRARPAEILVSGGIGSTPRRNFAFEPCGPLQLKGKQQAVDVYRLVSVGERGPLRERSGRALIGRDAELRRFRGILAGVRRGTGQLVTICGEAGVGKTRLLEEFVNHARQSGLALFRGECLASGQSVPGHAWAGLLRDLIGIARDDSGDVARARLVARLTRAHPELARWSPLLGELAGVPLPDSDQTSALAPRQRKEKLFAVFTELLTAQARDHPTLFVLEDLHWIDPLSRELLTALTARLAESPLLLLATCRPEFEPISVEPGRGVCFQLDPLAKISTAELLGHVLGGEASDRLCELVFEKTQGNPLYVEELVHALLASGQLIRNPATGRHELSADSATVDLPGTLQGLVLSRIDRLPEQHRRILQVAAVFGRTFPRDTLRAVLPFPLPGQDLAARLDEMARLELVTTAVEPGHATAALAEAVASPAADEIDRAAPDPARTCAFRHVLIQEAVYSSLSYARRREIHRAIGEELERAGDADEHCALLARHFDLARVSEKAFVYLALAGDKAKRASANAEAAENYDRALSHGRALGEAVPEPRLARLLEDLGDVRALLGDYAAAVDHFNEALNRTQQPIDRARLEGKLGGICYRQGQPGSGIEHLEAGLAHLGICLPRSGWRLRASLLCQALIQAAHTLFPRLFVRPRSRNAEAARAAIEIYEALSRISYESDLYRTLDAHLRQLNLSETLPDSPEMAQTYSSHGIVCGMIPLLGRALRYQRKGLAIRESRGDAWGLAQSLNFMGVCLYQLGRWEEARACLERSARMFDEIGDRWETEITYLILSFVALRFGELPQAGRHARTMLELSRRADDPQGMGWALGSLADACCRQGRLDQALAHAREALACSQRARDGMYLAVVRRTLGAIYLRMGRIQRAVVELQGAVQQIRDERLRHEYVMGAYAALAEARLACLGGGAESQPARRRALGEIRRLCRTAVARGKNFKNWLPEAYRVSALWAWAADRPRAAERFFERSFDAAHALGARYELALTWRDAGRFLESTGRPEARLCFAEAVKLFEACGAALDRDLAAKSAETSPARLETAHSEIRAPHLQPGRNRKRRRFPTAIFAERRLTGSSRPESAKDSARPA